MKLDHDETEFAARVVERLRRVRSAHADDALLARVHATLAAGPQREPASRRTWPRWLVAIAVAALIAVVVLRPAESLTAGAMGGTLQFDPPTARPGQTIHVRYQPNAALSRFDHVRLRARFRTPFAIPINEFERQVEVARLTPDRSGVFVGSFVFPDSAVFGAFAVEDDDARFVDANQRSLWTLLVADSAGVPTFEALEQRINDVATTNWELSLETAQRATSLHPDQVRGWVILWSLQQSILSRAGRDSAFAQHRTRLPKLDQRFASAEISSDELGAMVNYAGMLRDTVRGTRWSERLMRSNPRGVWGLYAAIDRGSRLMRGDPHHALVFFDSLWRAAGDVHPAVVGFGLTSALLAKDSATTALWIGRSLQHARVDVDTVAVAMQILEAPGFGDQAMALLRRQLRTTTADRDNQRALELARTANVPVEEERRARLLTLLANVLASRGEARASADTLALAASIGWDPALFRKLSAAALSLGDTARAIDALAHAAADPLVGATLTDSASTAFGRRFDRAAWERSVAAAREEMKSRVLKWSERTTLARIVTLSDSGGRQRQLADLVGGRPTLVAFWSMHCFYSIAQHGALAATARQLKALGYNTVAVTDEPLDSAMKATLAARKLDFPAYRDQNHDARLALAQWGTPEYFVLDGKGRLRFRLRSLESAAAKLVSVDER